MKVEDLWKLTKSSVAAHDSRRVQFERACRTGDEVVLDLSEPLGGRNLTDYVVKS